MDISGYTTTPLTSPSVVYVQPTSYVFPIAIFFLVIAISMLIIGIIYSLFWRPTVQGPTCSFNNNCDVGQICQASTCVERLCSSNLDCSPNNLCINSYCYAPTCNIGNDCSNGSACINGSCIQVGSSCTSNSDCFQLSCMNKVCVQCLANSDCPLGQGCFNRSCRFPYTGETGANQITFSSPAQVNGNITASPGYFCPAANCGTGTGSQTPIVCNDTNTCGGTCPYCINNLCRCTQGQISENCEANSDCISGLCSNNICVPVGGDCIYNYNGTGCADCCTVNRPYCVDGICSNVSLGAPCGSTGLPADMCNNPLSLGGIGITGVTSDGMGFFCVNGFCQEDPGTFNNLCSGNSCEFIQEGIFVCTPIATPSITQMRCLTLPT